MPFNLPDIRAIPTAPAVPTPILNSYTPIPKEQPSLSAAQQRAKIRVEEAWHRPLTHVQRRFISALFANGFEIAEAAYEADPGLNDEAEARRVGKKWMRLPSVINAIEAVHAYYTENAKIRLEDLVAELKIIAFSSMSDFWDADNECYNMPPQGDPKYKSVSELSVTPTRYGRAVRLRQHDKLGAIEKLMKLQQPTLPDGARPQEGENVYVNVQTVNIMPVPQGMYLPAPVDAPPPPLVIDNDSVLPQARELPNRDAFALPTK